MASGLLIDYLGHGDIADRPAAPTLYVGSIGLWWSDDTSELSLWDGTVWHEDIGGGGGGGSGTVTSVGYSLDAAVADILSASGSPITTSGTITVNAVDPGADRIVFWDDSAGKLTYLTVGSGLDLTATTLSAKPQSFAVACSDETTALTTGAAKVTFRMPYAFTLLSGAAGVRASLTNAQASGSILTVDINENGTTILSTKLTIDNTETTSTTAATPPVISDTSLADDSVITVDIDQIGTSGATGLKVYLIGYPT